MTASSTAAATPARRARWRGLSPLNHAVRTGQSCRIGGPGRSTVAMAHPVDEPGVAADRWAPRWQWLTVVAMGLSAVVAYGTAARIYLAARR